MKPLQAVEAFMRRRRIAAHKSMAFAALRADSSLSTRLTRYQHHMQLARTIEAEVNASTSTHLKPARSCALAKGGAQ